MRAWNRTEKIVIAALLVSLFFWIGVRYLLNKQAVQVHVERNGVIMKSENPKEAMSV